MAGPEHRDATAGSAAPGAAGVPYLDAARLQALLSPGAAVEAVQRFFGAHRREDVAAPPRIHLPVPGRHTVGLYMPAATPAHVGVKLAHLMPRRRPSVEAEIFLYDAETGRLLFWGDGKPLTGLRTAAVSAAASRRLQPRCRRLAVYGAGVQAAAHIAAFAAAYPELEAVEVVARSPESFERLAALVPEALRERVRPAADPGAALAAADCVVTTTPAPEPLPDWDALGPATHLVGIGSATPEMNELPPEAFLAGAVWVDTEKALEESGDLRRARAAGLTREDVAGDLFDLLGPDSTAEGIAARCGERRTVFKSVGHAAQDLALLVHLWDRLQAAGAGT